MAQKKKRELTPKDLPLEVFGEHIIIKRVKPGTTAGGIVMPDSDKRSKVGVVGLVLAAGEGRFLDNGQLQKMPVKPGDKVLFSGLAGLDLGTETQVELGIPSEVDLSEIYLIRQTDLIGKLTN